jgi:3',5'-cyclic AMP phosphodiesterase CpdA
MSTFAVISDPHVTVPNPDTGWTAPPLKHEPTMYGESVDLLKTAISEINAHPDVEFVLVAGDLTKDSEPYNHVEARELFSRFRKPVYCISGNHDQPRPEKLRPREYLDPGVRPVRTTEIPRLYGDFGFKDTQRPAYSCDPAPDVHLIGICSSKPDEDCGWISPEVLAWLDDDLSRQRDPARETIVMLHHSIIEHVPGEKSNPTFSWFHVENADALKAILRRHGVRITLTGHLHIQDTKEEDGLYNIATASLAGYPHAYRIMSLSDAGLRIESRRLRSIPSVPDLQHHSRRYTEDTFVSILSDVLGAAPFHYPRPRAERTAEQLRDWWPSIAEGDAVFDYTAEGLGDPMLAAYVNSFSDTDPPDNDLTIELERRTRS